MGHGHGVLGSVEEIIVLDLAGGIRGIIVCHSGLDHVADAGLHCQIKNFNVKELLNISCLVTSLQSLLHVIEISEWEGNLLLLLSSLDQLNEITRCLAEHDSVLTLIGRHG